jgi:hypothetical protein
MLGALCPSACPLGDSRAKTKWNRMTIDHIPQLFEALQRGTLALFIGADLDREVTGLPSRTYLARELARRYELDESLSLAQVAQRVSRSGYRHEFTAFILDALSGSSPQSFHHRIVELVQAHRIRTVVTTAYDGLLWLTFRDMGVSFNRVVRGSDVRFIIPDHPTLIKLYGDTQDLETLVVTEDDHYGLWRDQDKEDVLDEVRNVLRKNVILFLGYNLTDPDFNLLWREVLDRAGRFTMGAYAVYSDLSKDEKRIWLDRRVQIIEAQPLAFLERLVATAPEAGVEEKSERKGDGEAHGPKPTYGTGNRWAVLVGVNKYKDPYIADLKVCVDDVTAIHQSLDSSYQVAKLLTDATIERLPTRANILGELSIISQAAAESDLLLFYFTGHGIAEGGESYLLARDTRLSALKHTAVSMQDVRELMSLSPARAKVIILDACHSGASIGKTEPVMTPEFIRRVFEEAEGIAVLASCKQGQKSWQWPEKRRSVFTYYLLEALSGRADLEGKKGFVTISDASRYVTNGVKSWAADKGVPQTPTLQYTVAGDIILVRTNS